MFYLIYSNLIHTDRFFLYRLICTSETDYCYCHPPIAKMQGAKIDELPADNPLKDTMGYPWNLRHSIHFHRYIED